VDSWAILQSIVLTTKITASKEPALSVERPVTWREIAQTQLKLNLVNLVKSKITKGITRAIREIIRRKTRTNMIVVMNIKMIERIREKLSNL